MSDICSTDISCGSVDRRTAKFAIRYDGRSTGREAIAGRAVLSTAGVDRGCDFPCGRAARAASRAALSRRRSGSRRWNQSVLQIRWNRQPRPSRISCRNRSRSRARRDRLAHRARLRGAPRRQPSRCSRCRHRRWYSRTPSMATTGRAMVIGRRCRPRAEQALQDIRRRLGRQWATLWLFYFEEWLASDDWKGGGMHPEMDGDHEEAA
jgi:hypothetical protein